jgi:hypothetical protein
MMCSGEFLNKDPNEALEYLEKVAEIAQSWDTSDPNGSRKAGAQVPLGGGKYTLSANDELQAKVAQLTRKLESLELQKVNEVVITPKKEEVCTICDTHEHSTNECPTIPAFREILNEQVSVNAVMPPQQQKRPFNSPFSDTYNPGWRNHPNFGWRNENTTNQGPPPRIPSSGANLI